MVRAEHDLVVPEQRHRVSTEWEAPDLGSNFHQDLGRLGRLVEVPLGNLVIDGGSCGLGGVITGMVSKLGRVIPDSLRRLSVGTMFNECRGTLKITLARLGF